jgi:multidrug efflux pump subunit AcrA (membrane-fusion protein)
MGRRTLRTPAPMTIILAALAIAAIVVAIVVVGSPATSSAQERTVTVARGVVQSTVSGSGNLAPANQLDLDFATSGEITHIYVKEGQHVSEDQLLATIDDSSQKVDLAEAKADLQSAQDTLDEVQSGSSTTASASATTTPAPSESGSGSGSGSASGNSGSGAGGSGSASGASGSGSTMSEAAAEAAVESAELNVTKAEKALAATNLRAPMSGTIAEINGSVGETAGSSSSDSSSSSSSSSGPSIAGGLGGGGSSSSSSSNGSSGSSLITLAQISRYKMDVSLSESDIGSVKVGQVATVTVNAASGQQFAAKVTHIGVLSSSSGGGSSSSAVSYPVTLTLDQTGKGLKVGMSATADIVTDEVTGVAIPSQALSGSSVTVEDKDGKQTTQRVQAGVVGDSTTQIVSGLNVGDKVVIRSAAATAGAGAASGSNQINNALRNRVGGGGGLGGGGLGGGGFGGGPPGGGRTP